MVATMPYKNLTHSLRLLKGQIIEGIDYSKTHQPKFDSPEKIFNYYKARTQYRNDPKRGDNVNGVIYQDDTELFQTLPTFIENNVHGRTGLGDCDDFTIAALTTLLANGFLNSGIVLVGRSPRNAVHIYAYTEINGKRKYLDLTNKYFNQVRFYPYVQHVPFILTPTEKNKIMQLQLAEKKQGGSYQNNYALNPYIHFPSQGVQIREDYFDGMPLKEYAEMLDDEGYGLSEIAELAGRKAKREAKAEKKADPTKSKNIRKTKKMDKATKKRESAASKANKRNASADLKRSKGASKETKAGKGRSPIFGGKTAPDGDEEEGGSPGRTINPDKIIDVFGKVINKTKFGKGNQEDIENITGTTPKDQEAYAQEEAARKDTILGMPKKVAYGVGGLLLLTGLVIAGTQMKKRKRVSA